VLNKTDLLPYAGVSLDELTGNVRMVNPAVPVFAVSCRTYDGIDSWISWFHRRVIALRKREVHECA
jgi:hydrogenase nickel incorporation protein HypB